MLELARDALGWCAVINIALFLWWWLWFTLAHDFMFRIHTKWFDLSKERFDAVNYSGMAVFKIAIWVFNLTPYFALRLIG
jgi:hypothetical protein